MATHLPDANTSLRGVCTDHDSHAVRDKQFAPASKRPLKPILMSVTFYHHIGLSYGVCEKFPNLSVRLRL
ncbi:MAG: hypothetical protein ACTHKQ_25070, partial [Mesorhizobium sp.]